MSNLTITNITYRNHWKNNRRKSLKSEDPVISIVLPTLNGFPLIKRALKSILNQKFKLWELIIIDDGSTDANLKKFLYNINKKYTNIKLITLKHNGGLPNALNIGLENSKGKYWTWISDDNEFFPNTLYILKKRLDIGYSFVYSDFYFINNIDDKTSMRTYDYKNVDDILNSWQGMACYMWEMSLMKQIGKFGINLQGIEDYDYVIRTFLQLEQSKIYHEKTLLMNYYRNKNTLSIKLKDKIDKLKELIIKKYKNK
jgi:glycosyltransferase involved in cell wall biosynthesis